MATVTRRLAALKPIIFGIKDRESGSFMTDLPVQLRIGTGASCVIIDGVVEADRYRFDLVGLNLSSGYHRAEFYANDDGWSHLGSLGLNLQGGC